ncbi:hypothetical protein DSO57_1027932 [Entomophthora muscae]|uniref:Uncharacterized protein n=1 Tax=Entomophthora muscae TaxID=34485 RepID=A0ACC2SEI8_9FUNG|nr:hypothetical protein DSO57_1027932 [Entomophthora muscae]
MLSYIVKLAPILWWALLARPAGRLHVNSQEPPTDWIPDTSLTQQSALTPVLNQNIGIPFSAFNALSAQGFFQAPTTVPQATDKSIMPANIAQRLWSAALEPFSGANNNNATAWIQSAQSKLAQIECLQGFWIAEISIQLTYNSGTWYDKWHEDHTEKDWYIFKQDFLEKFMLKDTTLMIIRQVKNLTQVDMVNKLT